MLFACSILSTLLAAPAVSADPPAVVAGIRAEYRALLRIQAVLGWYESTQGEQSLGQLTYVGHERLFRRQAIEAVKRAAGGEASPADSMALRFLSNALAAERVSLATAPFDDAFANAEAAATVSVPFDPKPIAFRDLPNRIAAEPDAARRQALFAASSRVLTSQLNPILVQKEAAAQAAARETGFGDYVALSEALRAVRLEGLLEDGIRYLQATDAVYEALLDRVAREELGVPRDKLRQADMGRLWKAPALAKYFPKDMELDTLRRFLGGIGLDLRSAAGTEVRVDDSLHPKKRPRAFVNPVDAPGDVRMSVKPTGGLDDYWTLFHEAGHAVHFASSTIQPWELVYLGHGAPSEAFGEFFRHAFSDPRWLSRYAASLAAGGRPAPGPAEQAAILRRTALVEMMYLRRYAFAKIAYELELHGRAAASSPARAVLPTAQEGPAESEEAALRDLYRRLFSRAYAFRLTEEEAQRYRADVDDTFYAADYARCFALAGMMHEGIRRRFGADWYQNPAVGKFLKEELFSRGTSLTPEEVAVALGFPPEVDFQLAAQRAARLVEDADRLERSGGAQGP